ncbi:unnamed protein product [Penicillium olsonii]|uniref:Enoyl reductase (ER) domain-containing protein n=1 Tax=Penicillium olsonii TaxID=99116 RepID=A0A9W4HKQ4_PENOL|nr:unnamed protein product [Penicillium olsonii]CAG8091283.1 unnamed protein product [Penicillium olsonii]
MTMLPAVTHRRAFRRTDDFTPGTPKLKLVQEEIRQLAPTDVLIKVHAVALNYRDANIANGGNPWPVVPNGILCNDAAGEVVAVGDKVKTLAIGNRAGPITDTENISGREIKRSWLAADEDGVMADYIIFDEAVLCLLPDYLDWTEASMIPCAGVTAWSALKGMSIGQTVLIQGTGGVSVFALKLASAAGLRIILTSSSDTKLQRMRDQYPSILTVNYSKTPDWDKEVMKITEGAGVDILVENGGASSLVKSLRCTRRGGIVSQVGYLSGQDSGDLRELIPTIIDRRVILRGINAGSKHDMEDLCAALTAAQTPLKDLIDRTFAFEEAEEAVEYIWQGKQIGKIVLTL